MLVQLPLSARANGLRTLGGLEAAGVEETGLAPDQIEARVTWQNLEFLRWRQQFGDDGPESSS